MNYRREAEHDELLIKLVQSLDAAGRLEVLCPVFHIPPPGQLERCQKRKPFDVELTFDNFSCVVESKVDSDEQGRWDDSRIWQTRRILNESSSLGYLKPERHFLFLTYGTSEFYTKDFETGPGSGLPFRHVKLNDIIGLLVTALSGELNDELRPQFSEWLTAMQTEKRKREQAQSLLASHASFRRMYLEAHGDIDFPRNRLLFCAPEIAFPILNELRALWNADSRFHSRFKRVSVYPVNRLSPTVQDSVLNFWEMWDRREPAVGKDLLVDDENLYFEINEDLNLNLKLNADHIQLERLDSLRKQIHDRLLRVDWPIGLGGATRDYKQTTYVLFEWDCGLVSEHSSVKRVAENLYTILEKAVSELG